MKSAYAMGLEDDDFFNQTDIVGEDPHIPAAQMLEYKPLLKLSPLPTNDQGIRLMEQAYGVMEKSEDLNLNKKLGKDQELTNLADKIAIWADKLRKLDKNEKMSTSSWTTTRDLFFNALDTYAGVNEGATYKDTLLSKLVEDIGKNAEDLPGKIINKAGEAAKSVGSGVLKVAGIAIAGLLGIGIAIKLIRS
jgi:hypothetical protein